MLQAQAEVLPPLTLRRLQVPQGRLHNTAAPGCRRLLRLQAEGTAAAVLKDQLY